jgi:diguanylate cyclase (GGDEF)-like protein
MQAPVRKQESATGLHHCFYPVTLHGEVRGIVELKENHRPYQDEDALISNFIALYINCTHSLDASPADPLSGLLQSRFLEPAVLNMNAEAAAQGCCLAVVAIDHFDDVKQLYGHLFGDEVLRRVAAALKQYFGAVAQLFRLATDECVVLMPDMSASRLEADCGAFLEYMVTQEFPNIGQVTLSIGLTQIFEKETLVQIMERARQALSKAQSQNIRAIRRPGAR